MHVMWIFWPSTLSNGGVPGYQGGSDAAASQTEQMVHLMQAQILLTKHRFLRWKRGLFGWKFRRWKQDEVRMTVMMMEVQMIRKITAMIL